jgi:phosphohistidine phosphatase
MVDLYLLRHGIAVNAEDLPTGADRPLTDKGVKRMRKAARGLRRLGMKFEVILTSPLARAHQTATIVAEALGREAHVSVVEALKPDGAADELLSSLNDYANCESVLLVGHEPLLGDTVSQLLGGKKTSNIEIALKKGGLVRIEVDSLPPRNPGILHLLVAPKILRRLGASGRS